MELLTRDAFKKAGQFIGENGRPLEVARFKYEFCKASASQVSEALSSFQNSDGGFGCALEPDLRTQDSSALCTSIALQTLRGIGASNEHPIISSALKYLRDEFNRELLCWRIIPASAEKSPRAPWWYQEGREEQFESFSLNPTAEILGYLYDSPSIVPNTAIELISNRVLSEVVGLEKIEMHDLLCCLRLLKTESLPEAFRDQLYSKISILINDTICCNEEGWKFYSLRPLQVVDSPQSIFASDLDAAINLNLDYEIREQASNGAWEPTWSWDERYPNDWKTAKREWTAILTVEKLLLLKRFGRIEKEA